MAYRDAITDGTCYRGRPWQALKLGFFALLGLAITTIAIVRMVGGRRDWTTVGLLALFSCGTLVLSYAALEVARKRIFISETGLTYAAFMRRIELRWCDVTDIQWRRVNNEVSYTISGAGKHVVVGQDLRDFESAVRQLRQYLGPLPRDSSDE